MPNSFIYIDLESVSGGILLKEDRIFKKDAPSRAQRLLEREDILFQTVRPYQMNNLYFDKEGVYVASTGYAQLRTEQNPKFVFQYLHYHKFVNAVLEKCTGTSYPAINSTDLSNIKISFPCLEEQTKISSFLYLIDRRINTQNEIIKKYESLIKGIAEKLFIQQLRFKRAEENGFKKWENKFGNEVFESISNKKHNSDLPILAITQEHGAIPRDLIDYNIAVTDKSIDNYKVIDVGDFVISLRSFQGGIEYSEYKGICSPAYIILRPFIPINDLFFKYYFKTDKYITNLNRKLEGIRDGKMISYKYFSEIKIPLPSLEEQLIIASFLSIIEEKIKIEKSILKHLINQKKYLMQELFI